jgi:hypothetical protein
MVESTSESVVSVEQEASLSVVSSTAVGGTAVSGTGYGGW